MIVEYTMFLYNAIYNPPTIQLLILHVDITECDNQYQAYSILSSFENLKSLRHTSSLLRVTHGQWWATNYKKLIKL